MRYHYEKPKIFSAMYGEVYVCDHPVYSRCTLYKCGDKGLAVIQQRYIPETKCTYWGEIDLWLTDAIYLSKGFREYFKLRAKAPADGLYQTVTIRQIM